MPRIKRSRFHPLLLLLLLLLLPLSASFPVLQLRCVRSPALSLSPSLPLLPLFLPTLSLSIYIHVCIYIERARVSGRPGAR